MTYYRKLVWRGRLSSEEKRWLLRWAPIFVFLWCTNLAAPLVSSGAETTLTPLAGISKDLTNHSVTVQATITDIREPRSERAPFIVTLTESNASLPFVYWQNQQAQVGSTMKVGNVVRIPAFVSVYRGDLQLKIQRNATVELISAAPPSTNAAHAAEAPAAPKPVTPPTTTVIGKIKADWVDRTVIISGTISGSDGAVKTGKFTVADATGEIQVILSNKILVMIQAGDFQPGRVVKVTGVVKLVDGKPAIAPAADTDLALAPSP